jgi:tRNA wybutosine-synthesizing protein 3
MEGFEKRKQDVLSKEDKSSIGKWDNKIIKLCNKINSLKNYYTTSSCSGRILLIIDQEKKSKNLFVFVSHEKMNFKKFKQELLKSLSLKKNIKFKLESFILHINAKSLENVKNFLEISKKAGIKKMGIIGLKNNFTIEIQGSEKLEFPIIKNNKILVDDYFLKTILKESNKKLEKNWKKIKRLTKELDFLKKYN